MPEISVNQQIGELLANHGIDFSVDNEFVYANLPSKIKIKARAVYREVNNYISSQMDVMVISDNGDKILESFADFGKDIEIAINNNLANFSISMLHPLLAAFGSTDNEILRQITIEDWGIKGKRWTAYIGNLIPKTNNKIPNSIAPPDQFFNAIETGIHAQHLNNNLHWFRGFYAQLNGKITDTEFLMDNKDVTNTNTSFSIIPVIADVEFYSCRNFIILRRVT